MTNILNAEKGEIQVYAPIGAVYGDRGVTAKAFRTALDSLKGRDGTIRVGSDGGCVKEAVEMYNAMKEYPGKLTTIVDSLAASAATYLVVAASERKMAANALMMIHDPMGATIGDADEHRKQAEVLDKLKDTIVGMYKDRSGRPENQVRDWMTAETWFDATEAKDCGFIDEILANVGENSAKRATPFQNLLNFRNVPRSLLLANEFVGTPRIDAMAARLQAAG